MPPDPFTLPASLPPLVAGVEGIVSGILFGLIFGATLVWLILRIRRDTAMAGLQAAYDQSLQDGYLIRRVVESTSDGLLVQKMSGKIIWANPAYCQMMMRPLEEIVGRNPMEFVLPERDTPTAEEIANFRYDPHKHGAAGLHLAQNVRSDGQEFWNQINVSFRTAPDGTEHAILSCRDVTEQVEHNQALETIQSQLAHNASHDSLTGIANRAELIRFTEAALAKANKTGRQIGMIRIDLDKFKEINDTYGHPAGDAVLINVAKVLKSKLRSTDLASRMGGDEFTIVCPDISALEDLSKIAKALNLAISQPFDWGEGTLKCGGSFGVALSEPGMLSPEDLLQHSDFALYEVKRRGRGGVAAYDAVLDQRYSSLSKRRAEFADCLRNDDLAFHFQPTVNLKTGAISGFETLVRWDHPTAGILGPDKILPLAEELGVMADLDRAAITAALDFKVMLQNAGFGDIRVGVNASGEGLLHPDYVMTLDKQVTRKRINPDQIAIEVLETVMLDRSVDTESHQRVIAQLHDMGFHTMLDDFGVGHAGLSHLAQLQLSGVKADRSLASRVVSDRTSNRIMRTMIELCDDLGLRIIAEGVETADVAACLRDMGCKIMQGYWLSKPLPANQVIPWLMSYSASETLAKLDAQESVFEEAQIKAG